MGGCLRGPCFPALRVSTLPFTKPWTARRRSSIPKRLVQKSDAVMEAWGRAFIPGDEQEWDLSWRQGIGDLAREKTAELICHGRGAFRLWGLFEDRTEKRTSRGPLFRYQSVQSHLALDQLGLLCLASPPMWLAFCCSGRWESAGNWCLIAGARR
jgi:hypothetical protein